jgi:hypothetical protein
MITRRKFIVGAGTVGALGVALRVPAGAGASAPGLGAAAAGSGVVLKIVQATAASRGAAAAAPTSAVDAPLLWRLGAYEILDPRRLDERLARRPATRIHAVVDGGNHLLLVDALRQHDGAILKERWSPAEQRWTLIARTGRTSAR